MQKTVKKTQKGFTLIELLIVIAVIAILAAIAIPNLLSSRKAANESSAISSVRTLISAQETYRSRKGTYAANNAALGTAKLVDSLLGPASGDAVKSGYKLVTSTASGTEASKYTIVATPSTAGTTGDRSFFADESGVIRATESGTATVSSDPIQ